MTNILHVAINKSNKLSLCLVFNRPEERKNQKEIYKNIYTYQATATLRGEKAAPERAADYTRSAFWCC